MLALLRPPNPKAARPAKGPPAILSICNSAESTPPTVGHRNPQHTSKHLGRTLSCHLIFYFCFCQFKKLKYCVPIMALEKVKSIMGELYFEVFIHRAFNAEPEP